MAKQEVYKLDNGATLIYQKHTAFNGSSVVLGFRSGAQLDGKYKGLSHLLEHLLFRDYKPAGTTRTLNNVLKYSINQNAFTGKNFISLNFSATENNLEPALDNLMNSVITRKYTPEQIKLEKEIVKQEINMYKDEDDDISALELLTSTLREGGNNMSSADILGTPKSLSLITPEILAEYKRRYFNTDNLVISVTSNKPAEDIIKIFEEKVFSRLPRAKSSKYIIEPSEPREFVRENKMCVFPCTPSYNVKINLLLRERDDYAENPDKEFAYDIVEEYLMNDIGGFLYDALRVKNNLVYEYDLENCDCGNGKFKNFSATTNAANMRKTIRTLCDLIYDFGINGIPEAAFNTVKKAITDRENAKLQKFRTCSARSNFSDYMNNIPFIDYKAAMNYIKNMTYEEFNEHVTSIYKQANVSVAVEGMFDKRKMYRLIEIEQMLGNFSHADDLLNYNTPIFESTQLPDKATERYQAVIQEEFVKQMEELANKDAKNNNKKPAVTIDDEMVKQ